MRDEAVELHERSAIEQELDALARRAASRGMDLLVRRGCDALRRGYGIVTAGSLTRTGVGIGQRFAARELGTGIARAARTGLGHVVRRLG
jgi:hypothetical protein